MDSPKLERVHVLLLSPYEEVKFPIHYVKESSAFTLNT